MIHPLDPRMVIDRFLFEDYESQRLIKSKSFFQQVIVEFLVSVTVLLLYMYSKTFVKRPLKN